MVLAVGVFSFVGVALIGLFSVGLRTNRESVDDLEATHLAGSLLGTRRASPVADLPGFPLPTLAAAANNTTNVAGDGTPTNQSAARFGLVYRITPDTNAKVSRVYLCLYWPPQASPTNARGRFETFSAFPLP